MVEIRRRILLWRRSLEPGAVAERSRDAGAVAAEGTTAMLGCTPTHVWSYALRHGEVDPDAVTSRWWPAPEIALPVVVGDNLEGRVGATATVRGAFGVAEPVDGTPVDVDWADVVLVPVVAFAQAGARWGHGKGYYDRALGGVARFPGGPLLVGLAYDEQETGALQPAAWDVPMDAIATPTRWIPARAGGPSGRGQAVSD